jgi:AcrR family transcriptional regulator
MLVGAMETRDGGASYEDGAHGRGARERALVAMAGAVADHGYADTTVEDVVRRARMSRRTFYDLFRNREECFLAAYDAVREGTMTRLAGAHAGAPSRWPAHVERALTAVLEYFADRPEFARLFVVEALAAGSPGLERHERTMREFAAHLARSHPSAAANSGGPAAAGRAGASDVGSDLSIEATVGAVHRIVHARIVDGRAGELPALAPELTALVRSLARPGGRG